MREREQRESESRVLPMPERRGEEGDLRKLFFRGGKGGGERGEGKLPVSGKSNNSSDEAGGGKKRMEWSNLLSSLVWSCGGRGIHSTVL